MTRPLIGGPAGGGGPGGGGIGEITSIDGSLTVTNPNGPSTDLKIANVFGTEAQHDNRQTPATTSSATFTNYFNFNTTALVGGDYYLTFSFALSGPGANIDLGARMVFPSGPTAEIAMGTSTASGLVIAHWDGVITGVTAGNKLVSFEFRKIAGTGDVTAESVFVSMWRFM